MLVFCQGQKHAVINGNGPREERRGASARQSEVIGAAADRGSSGLGRSSSRAVSGLQRNARGLWRATCRTETRIAHENLTIAAVWSARP